MLRDVKLSESFRFLCVSPSEPLDVPHHTATTLYLKTVWLVSLRVKEVGRMDEKSCQLVGVIEIYVLCVFVSAGRVTWAKFRSCFALWVFRNKNKYSRKMSNVTRDDGKTWQMDQGLGLNKSYCYLQLNALNSLVINVFKRRVYSDNSCFNKSIRVQNAALLFLFLSLE